MGLFDRFKSDQKKVLALVGGMYGVEVGDMEMLTEVGDWFLELDEHDPRKQRVPPELVQGTYYFIGVNREQGSVFHILKDELQIRCPMQMTLHTGVSVPASHLYKKIPHWALLAIGDQRAQKVIRNLVSETEETFRQHQKMCSVCYKLIDPIRFPGHSEEGILGPPHAKFKVCKTCQAKQGIAEKKAAAKS